MKKTIIIALAVVLVAAIGISLATTNSNSDVFTATTFRNEHDSFGTWKNTEVTTKYSYEEVRNMAKDHTVYWIHTGDIDGIGIEIEIDEVILVFNTDDERLTHQMGPYKIWY